MDQATTDNPSTKPGAPDVTATDNTLHQAAPAKGDRYRTYVLIMLTVVYAFNFIDRQIIGILSPFIKDDLGLSDAQLGWLKGIYFALLYTTVGIPIAWLADRYSRVNIIAVSLTLWSGFTALSGLASNYMQLALARIGVGIGEAGGSPPSHSIISDLYKKEERAAALAIYSLGIPFGIMVAFFCLGVYSQRRHPRQANRDYQRWAARCAIGSGVKADCQRAGSGRYITCSDTGESAIYTICKNPAHHSFMVGHVSRNIIWLVWQLRHINMDD